MTASDPSSTWGDHFPSSHAELAARGLAYYRGGDPTKPVVYEDFLPISAAGIFRSNLDAEPAADQSAPSAAEDHFAYDAAWLAGAIGQPVHDPYDLYEKAAAQ